MIEKSIQTKNSEVFVISRPNSGPDCFCGAELRPSHLHKREPKLISIENLIIDLLVFEHWKSRSRRQSDFILRDPFKPNLLFKNVNTSLQYSHQADLDKLRSYFAYLNGPPIADLLEQTMTLVWRSTDSYLNNFHQYIYHPNRNLIEALSVFTVFLSKHFRLGLVSFVVRFLLVIFYIAFGIYHTHFNVQRVLSRSSDYKDLVEQAQRLMPVIFGNNNADWLDPSLVFRVFREYLISNGFLAIVEP